MSPRGRLLEALEVLNALIPHTDGRADSVWRRPFNDAWRAAWREASAAADAYAKAMTPPRRRRRKKASR